MKHGQCARCVKLAAENKTLKDLLETQYRETDKARVEAEKAVEHKIVAARLKMLKRRLERAEAKLAASSGGGK